MSTVGRRALVHPPLGSAGGSALYASIENLWTIVSNDDAGRFSTFTSAANASVITYVHNLGVPLSELRVFLYTGTYPSLAPVIDTAASGWTIAPTTGSTTTSIDITVPSTGGPFTGAFFVLHSRAETAISGALAGQFLTYDTSSGKFINQHMIWSSEVATIATNVLTPTTTRPTQRITSFTGANSDLQTIANPQLDKPLVIINETAADITIKHDTGSPTTARIYTSSGLDQTLKAKSAVIAYYDSALQRWLVIGGGGGGAKNTIEAVASVASAVTNNRYAFRLTAAGQTIQFPTDTSAFEITILDAAGNFATYPLTINGITGQTIATGTAGEAFSCNYNSFLGTFSRAQGSTKINFDPQMTSTVPQATATTLGTVSGGQLPGKIDGSAVANFAIGERVVITTNGSSINAPASGSYGGDYAFTLTPGIWDLSAAVTFSAAGSTMSQGVEFFIGTVAGSNATGRIPGDNHVTGGLPGAAFNLTLAMSGYELRLATTQIFYLKIFTAYSAGQPVIYYRVSARRVG